MALQGNFADMPLIDLFHVFQNTGKTGRLLIFHIEHKAMIWFVQGAVVHALVIKNGTTERVAIGEPAIFMLLRWEDGKFIYLAPQAHENYPISIKNPIDWLIIQALNQRNQQLIQTTYARFSPMTRLRLISRINNDQVSLGLEDWRVLSQLVNECSVDQVSKNTGYSLEQTIQILDRLTALNLVEIIKDIVIPERQAPRLLPDDDPNNSISNQQRVRNLVAAYRERLKLRQTKY